MFESFHLLKCNFAFRIVMEIYPVLKMQVPLDDGGESEPEAGPYSLDAFSSQSARTPSPFSAKRIVHESDTPHTKPHQGKIIFF